MLTAADTDLPWLPLDLARGLERLARAAPLWPVSPAAWDAAVTLVTSFAWRWDAPARAAGWTALALYGLHPRAPYTRLDAMGVAWLCARGNYRAIAVAPEAFTVESAAGNPLRIPRREPGEGAVLAWDLCR
jgi:hypothetical protein